jgi:GrpB-like predicted nucleotidyltransferase (UPF0157 family)
MNEQMREVIMVPYNPAWPQQFAEEASRLYPVYWMCWVSIFHIGSTAVPGLLSKSTLDLMLVVQNIQKVDAFDELISSLGYTPRGEFGIPGRRYFHQGDRVHKTHLHVFEHGSPQVERHLLFRDYLRCHPLETKAYAALKVELAERYKFDPVAYTNGKDEFIQSIDRLALEWKEQLGWQIPISDWNPDVGH